MLYSFASFHFNLPLNLIFKSLLSRIFLIFLYIHIYQSPHLDQYYFSSAFFIYFNFILSNFSIFIYFIFRRQADLACGPRILTFFLYLSDVEEGGETAFPMLGISVKPKKGKALLWPSVIDSDLLQYEARTLHEVSLFYFILFLFIIEFYVELFSFT